MIKVFQWASGNIGRRAARAVLARPNLELIGLHVQTPAKAGQDAGTVLGLDPLGIEATRDIAVVLDSDADVVLHAPLPSMVYGQRPEQDLEDFEALLRAGRRVPAPAAVRSSRRGRPRCSSFDDVLFCQRFEHIDAA